MERPITAQELFALVNVGDSRTYLLRHGRLRRVTIDHSYVQELVATGHITDDEARTHPRRNIVTRALGIDPAVRVDAWTLPIVRGDRFLLCSDGLVDEVRDDDIVEVLRDVEDPQQAAEQLVELANRSGGRDNITVIVVDVLDGAPPPDPDTELDLEPVWQDGGATGTWTVDDPDGQPTEFADLAALVGGQSPEEAEAATTEPPAEEVTAAPHAEAQAPRRRVVDRARRPGRADPRLRHRRGVGPARVLRGLQRRGGRRDLPRSRRRVPVVRADRGRRVDA